MLLCAAADPDVVSIKMTLYRMASDSQIVNALIAAAENGKEVVAMVELRARFDEQNNIDWSKQLEDAGCTVFYGFDDYKVHSKLTLITSRKDGKYKYLTQIGTGNYNEKTSELYTDLSFITTRQEIGEEASAVFNNMALQRLTSEADTMLVAPLRFKSASVSVPLPGPTSTTRSVCESSARLQMRSTTPSLMRKCCPSDFFVLNPNRSSTALVSATEASEERRAIFVTPLFPARSSAMFQKRSYLHRQR